MNAGGLLAGPVVEIWASNAGGADAVPGQGAKIPHALWPKNPKQKQYSNRCSKGFKKWSKSENL